jgi:ankyrin repeat protein
MSYDSTSPSEVFSFNTLPLELQQLIILKAGFLTEGVKRAVTLERIFIDIIDHTLWKKRFYRLFPNVKLLIAPPSVDATEEDKKQFWKGCIRDVGNGLLASIKDTDTKKLYRAILNNDVVGIESLLENNKISLDKLLDLNQNIKTNTFYLPGMSPVLLASYLGWQAILDSFYEYTAKEDPNNILFLACVFNQMATIQDRVTADNVNQPIGLTDNTLILTACMSGYFELVKLLIKKGAHINQARKSDGVTPVWMSCQNGHFELTKLLIEKGADIHQANSNCTTPLWMACQMGHFELTKLLIEKGADIEKARKSDVATPLWIACQNGHFEVVKLLIEKGADIKKARSDGFKALIKIASQGNHDTIKTLLKARELINALTEEGVITGFRQYVATHKTKYNFSSVFRRFDSSIENYYVDIVQEALVAFDNQNLQSFMTTLLSVAKKNQVNLDTYPRGTLSHLMSFAQAVLKGPVISNTKEVSGGLVPLIPK